MKRIIISIIAVLIIYMSGCNNVFDFYGYNLIKFDNRIYSADKVYNLNYDLKDEEISEICFEINNRLIDRHIDKYVVLEQYIEELKNMESTIVRKGTEIYTLKNYPEDFMLAAKINDVWVIYESYDYTSIKGMVRKIEILSYGEKELLGEISDMNKIKEYLKMFADTCSGYPKDIKSNVYNKEKRCYVSFVLEDGYGIENAFYYDEGYFYGYQKIPQDFTDEIRNIVENSRE